MLYQNNLSSFYWRGVFRLPLFSFFLLFSIFLNGSQISEKVLICGVCRNVETHLQKTIAIMESIGYLFDDYKILVYENNSTDQTKSILLSWAKNNPNVWIKSEDISGKRLKNLIFNKNADGSLFVPEQIARARNIVLEEALNPAYDNFPYLIWIDMDFDFPPDLEGFIDTFQNPIEWDAVFAYGIAPDNKYWDWYAFRDANYPYGPELLGMYWYKMDRESNFRLSQNDPWYPVYSAFGGCGIYKKTSIQGCRYSALVTKDLEIHTKNILKQKEHPLTLTYFDLMNGINTIHMIENPNCKLPKIFDPKIGIVLNQDFDPLIWRMNTYVYQYPSVCEHVPFHASMIIRGYNKLYINPKLIFRYGS